MELLDLVRQRNQANVVYLSRPDICVELEGTQLGEASHLEAKVVVERHNAGFYRETQHRAQLVKPLVEEV